MKLFKKKNYALQNFYRHGGNSLITKMRHEKTDVLLPSDNLQDN